MNKIGVVIDVTTLGPGSKKMFYSDENSYTYTSDLSIVTCKGSILKPIKPNYNKDEIFHVGSLVVYNDLTNEIVSKKEFNNYSDEDLIEINLLLQMFVKRLTLLNRLGMSLKKIINSDSLINIEKIKYIIDQIRRQLYIIKQLKTDDNKISFKI